MYHQSQHERTTCKLSFEQASSSSGSSALVATIAAPSPSTAAAARSLHSWRMVPQQQQQQQQHAAMASTISLLQQQHHHYHHKQQQQQYECSSIQQQQQQRGHASNPWLAHHASAFASDASKPPADGDKPADADAASSSSSSSGDDEAAGEQPLLSVEQLTAELRAREQEVEDLQAKVADLADSFKRGLADMENLRQRTARQVENAQKFAVEVRCFGVLCFVCACAVSLPL
jgi:molecular chaperone GrpE (heat shock protein)